MRFLRLFAVTVLLTVIGFAQGGLAITLVPPTVVAGEPCDKVKVRLNNLAASASYSVAFLVTNHETGAVVYLYAMPTPVTGTGGATEIEVCVELASGMYDVTIALTQVAPSGGTQVLWGTVTVNSQ